MTEVQVSVLIPCFNARPWIAQAIDSALMQTGPATEVIVIDDGSTDGSLDVIRTFDGRILWEASPNRGSQVTRNRLLDMARGAWVQYLDADDYLRPGKVAHQFKIAAADDCDVVYGATACEVKRGDSLITVDEAIPEPHDPWILLAHWQLPQTGGSLWRKRALQDAGGWRTEQTCCQEHELYFRLLRNGARFAHAPGCLAVYRFWDHGGRLSDRLGDEVHRQRLMILDEVERFLSEAGGLTHARLKAINDTRLAAARSLWPSDRAWARQVESVIRNSDPDYYPVQQPHGPPLYSLTYRLLGFDAAEQIARYRRRLFAAH
jgi:glycosyltransferase involved in cell wall biosynthesis